MARRPPSRALAERLLQELADYKGELPRLVYGNDEMVFDLLMRRERDLTDPPLAYSDRGSITGRRTIGVPTRAYGYTLTPDEVAYLMAHEVSHSERHHLMGKREGKAFMRREAEADISAAKRLRRVKPRGKLNMPTIKANFARIGNDPAYAVRKQARRNALKILKKHGLLGLLLGPILMQLNNLNRQGYTA